MTPQEAKPRRWLSRCFKPPPKAETVFFFFVFVVFKISAVARKKTVLIRVKTKKIARDDTSLLVRPRGLQSATRRQDTGERNRPAQVLSLSCNLQGVSPTHTAAHLMCDVSQDSGDVKHEAVVYKPAHYTRLVQTPPPLQRKLPGCGWVGIEFEGTALHWVPPLHWDPPNKLPGSRLHWGGTNLNSLGPCDKPSAGQIGKIFPQVILRYRKIRFQICSGLVGGY